MKDQSNRNHAWLWEFMLYAIFIPLLLIGQPKAYAYAQTAIINQETIKEGIVDIQYPVVILDDAAAARKVNTAIFEHIGQFHSAVSNDPHTLTAQSRYVIHYNADGILSLSITDYVFTGGAHGMSYRKGFTFDLASGELYKFSDLVPNSAREQINREITRQIGANDIPMLQPFTEIKQEPDFYLLPDRKLAIFYQLYELAPYVWGFVTFPISY